MKNHIVLHHGMSEAIDGDFYDNSRLLENENPANLIAFTMLEATDRVVSSNYSIANSIFKTSEAIFNGLSGIAEELEQKRCLEEHYTLKDKIYQLEDKIMDSGKNLKEVYDSTDMTFKDYIQIAPDQLLLLAYVFRKDESLAWLKHTITQKQPTNAIGILFDLLYEAKIIFQYDEHRDSYKNRLIAQVCSIELLLEEDVCKTHLYTKCSECIAWHKRISNWYDQDRIPCYSTTAIINLTLEEIDFWINDKLAYLQSLSYIDKDLVGPVESLNKSIAMLNLQTSLSNLRMIYENLRTSYKNIRLGE